MEETSLSDVTKDSSSEINLGFKLTQDHADEWEKHYLKLGHSYISTKTYASFIRRYIKYSNIIDQKHVTRFRIKNVSSVCAAALKNFFEFMVYSYGLPEEVLNIRFGSSKKKKKDIEYISDQDITKILSVWNDTEHGKKERLLTITLYSLGLRLQEGLKLTWDDFNWKEWLMDKSKQGTVKIRKTKGDKSRTLPVSNKLMNLLYDTHEKRSEEGIPLGGFLFDFGISSYNDGKKENTAKNSYDYLNYAKNKYRDTLLQVCGIAFGLTNEKKLNKRIHPHQLRHARALDMTDKDVPIEVIKDYLGHESIVSTQVYTHASSEKLKRDLEKYDKEKSGI